MDVSGFDSPQAGRIWGSVFDYPGCTNVMAKAKRHSTGCLRRPAISAGLSDPSRQGNGRDDRI